MPVRIDRLARFCGECGEPGIDRTGLRRSLEPRDGRGAAPRPDLGAKHSGPRGRPGPPWAGGNRRGINDRLSI